MPGFSRSSSLAALLVSLAVACAVAQAESDAPPAHGAPLGLAIARLDESWRDAHGYRASGVMIVGVDPRGRAGTSGIVAGDVLVSVGGRSMHQPSDLGYAERSIAPDRPVSLVLARDGGRMIKIFEIPPAPAEPVEAATPVEHLEFAAPPPAPAERAAAVDSSAAGAVADPAAAASVAAGVAMPDTTASPAMVAVPDAASDSTSPHVIASTTAAADSTTSPAVSTASAAEPRAAGQGSGASPPSPTTAGAAGSTAVAGAASSSAAADVATPVALSASGVIAASPAVSSVAASGGPAASTSATVDSAATPAGIVEPAPAVIGVVGKPLTPDLAAALGATGVEGILVLEVAGASPADRAGIRAGDIITKVADQPVSNMSDLQRALGAGSTTVPVVTLRLGRTQATSVSLEGAPPSPVPPQSQEQLLMELRDEVRSLRREVEGMRKKPTK